MTRRNSQLLSAQQHRREQRARSQKERAAKGRAPELPVLHEEMHDAVTAEYRPDTELWTEESHHARGNRVQGEDFRRHAHRPRAEIAFDRGEDRITRRSRRSFLQTKELLEVLQPLVHCRTSV